MSLALSKMRLVVRSDYLDTYFARELRAEMQALRKCEPAASWLTPGLADSGVFVCRTTAEEEQSLASHRVSTDAACTRLARDLRVMIALSDIACGLLFCSC